jgi:hypothetical protein
MTARTVTLSEAQCVWLRMLLFEELHQAAEALAEKAANASEGHADQESFEGDDARAAYRHRVQVTAELLDMVGWSVRTDVATLVKFERERDERFGGVS